MLTPKYAFHTDLKRAGHSICWCPPLEAIIHFGGGRPPTIAHNEFINRETQTGKLYYLTISDIETGIKKTDAVIRKKERKMRKRYKENNNNNNNNNEFSPTAGWLPMIKPINHYKSIEETPPPLPGEEIKLHWRTLPGSWTLARHGHHLIYFNNHIYLIGGGIWDEGSTLAPYDLCFNIKKKRWSPRNPYFAPHMFSALEQGNCLDSSKGIILYKFGGIDVNGVLTNKFYRLWLPSGRYTYLSQSGDIPPPQLKGFIVCNIQKEVTPTEYEKGLRSEGNIFYGDGFPTGETSSLSIYNYDLQTGVWRKIGLTPYVVRAEVLNRCYHPITGALIRFDILGSEEKVKEEVALAGKKRKKPAYIFSFCVNEEKWDYHVKTTLSGFTSHTIVQMPFEPNASSPERKVFLKGEIISISYGGCEEISHSEINDFAQPIDLLYLFVRRDITLREAVAVKARSMFQEVS